MRTRLISNNPAAYAVVWELQAWHDLGSLDAQDRAIADAAITAVEDLAHRRKIGKALGERHVSGDLTGLYRLKFDVTNQRPERFRLVYRLEPTQNPHTLVVVIIGIRDEHEVYQTAVTRLAQQPPST